MFLFFSRIFESLPPLPRQHSAAIGCTKKYQPIEVTVHSHCVESFEGRLAEGGVAVNSEHPVHDASLSLSDHLVLCRKSSKGVADK